MRLPRFKQHVQIPIIQCTDSFFLYLIICFLLVLFIYIKCCFMGKGKM